MTHQMEQHPDIIRMRERYEVAAAKPAVQVADGLTLLAGLFLAASPWIVGFTGHSGLTGNNVITGLTVALLALAFSSAFGRTYGLAWTAPLIGLWTIVAPWVIRGETATTATVVSNVVVGAIIAILGFVTMSMAMTKMR
ncbi:SPW repeat protein [Nonomuraea jiangxiensis]|uniref:SPW repeat-containing protein n=1 Tax=Nonomuraea jiangxiensis TaxID=633440 RepID=A0A1G9AS11_9ACTN|nr:SPW repeat protein [Nonomuraea jiangxiensis]SDK30122.1 SPW repeat-containing protein [Nonomuraea jiangxiensis]